MRFCRPPTIRCSSCGAPQSTWPTCTSLATSRSWSVRRVGGPNASSRWSPAGPASGRATCVPAPPRWWGWQWPWRGAATSKLPPQRGLRLELPAAVDRNARVVRDSGDRPTRSDQVERPNSAYPDAVVVGKSRREDKVVVGGRLRAGVAGQPGETAGSGDQQEFVVLPARGGVHARRLDEQKRRSREREPVEPVARFVDPRPRGPGIVAPIDPVRLGYRRACCMAELMVWIAWVDDSNPFACRRLVITVRGLGQRTAVGVKPPDSSFWRA